MNRVALSAGARKGISQAHVVFCSVSNAALSFLKAHSLGQGSIHLFGPCLGPHAVGWGQRGFGRWEGLIPQAKFLSRLRRYNASGLWAFLDPLSGKAERILALLLGDFFLYTLQSYSWNGEEREPWCYLVLFLCRGGPAHTARGAAGQHHHHHGGPQHHPDVWHPRGAAAAHHLEAQRHHPQLPWPGRHQCKSWVAPSHVFNAASFHGGQFERNKFCLVIVMEKQSWCDVLLL